MPCGRAPLRRRAFLAPPQGWARAHDSRTCPARPLGLVQVERRNTKNVVDLLDELATTNKAANVLQTAANVLQTAVVAKLTGMETLLSKQVEAEAQKAGGELVRAFALRARGPCAPAVAACAPAPSVVAHVRPGLTATAAPVPAVLRRRDYGEGGWAAVEPDQGARNTFV